MVTAPNQTGSPWLRRALGAALLVGGLYGLGVVLESVLIEYVQRIALLPHHASAVAADTDGTLQLGCAFVDLDTAASRSLQVYVDQTQKRRRLLKLDL